MLKSLSLSHTSQRPLGNLLSCGLPLQPQDTNLSNQPSGTASNMSRIQSSSNPQDFLNTSAGQEYLQHFRQTLALLCTGRLLPTAAVEPAAGQAAAAFQHGWQLLQERCFSNDGWPERQAAFEQKRRGNPQLTFEHYLRGLAVTELAQWLPATGLQPDRPALLATAQSEEQRCPNLQYTMRAVLWQPDADRKETRSQLINSVGFYNQLEKTICYVFKEHRPSQNLAKLKESNEYHQVYISTLEKLTDERDWNGVVGKYRATLAGGLEPDFRAYYWKHAGLAAKEKLRPLLKRSPADFAQVNESAQSPPERANSETVNPDDVFSVMESLNLTSTQQSVFLLRPWLMPAYEPCRAKALKIIVAGSAEPGHGDQLAARLHEVSVARSAPFTPDTEDHTGHSPRDPQTLFREMELAQASKIHIFRSLFQHSSPDPHDRQLLLELCLNIAADTVSCTSLDQVRTRWSPGAEAYSTATPGTRRPVNVEAQAKHDLRNFAESCYEEFSARRRWLKTRIQLQANREKEILRDPEIARVLEVEVGTVEAAATQIRQAMRKPAAETQQSLLIAWGFRDTVQELRSQLAEQQLQQAVCSGLDLNQV